RPPQTRRPFLKAQCRLFLAAKMLFFENQVSNLERQLFRFEVGAIAKNDYAEPMAFRESFDGRAKTHGASGMPHARPPLIRVEEPAEAIPNGLAGMQIVVVGLFGPVR